MVLAPNSASPSFLVDLFAAHRFLDAICGAAGQPVWFQTFDDNKERNNSKLCRKLRGTFKEHFSVLVELNRNGAGIFVQINEGASRSGVDITQVRALFADFDGSTEQPNLESSIIVKSGGEGRFHHFWLLQPGENIDEFLPAQRSIARKLKTDAAMGDQLNRVMRLPGFFHQKIIGRVVRTQLVKCDPTLTYTIQQVIEGLKTEIKPEDREKETKRKSKPNGVHHNVPKNPESLTKAEYVRLGLQKVKYSFKEHEDHDKFVFDLPLCPLNREHHNTARILVFFDTGAIHGGCFHESCGGNQQRWLQFKAAIGGWITRMKRGDHVEVATQLLKDNPNLIGTGRGLANYATATGTYQFLEEKETIHLISAYAGSRFGQKGTVKLKESDVKAVNRLANAIALDAEFFDRPSLPGVAFTNGYAAVRPDGVELLEHDRKYRVLAGLPFAYDPKAPRVKWTRFLNECLPGPQGEAKQQVLQEFAGACLARFVTERQKALILYGEGFNGKSVFIEVLKSLFPQGFVSAIAPQKLDSDYMKAALAGMYLNAVSEIPETDILNSTDLKALITGDPIQARFPYGKPFIFTPQAGHVFSANTLPSTSDHSKAFWRRFLLIHFDYQIPEQKRIFDLAKQIIAEELPGVAVWALEGAARLRSQSCYTRSEALTQAITDWREEVDPVAQWAAEAVEARDDAKTAPMAIYENFCFWAIQRNYKQLGYRKFFQRLKGLGFEAARTKTTRFYRVVLVSPPTFIFP